ncbi:MAG: TolB family protein [bacterium]
MKKSSKILLIIFGLLFGSICVIGILIGFLMSPISPVVLELVGIYPGKGFGSAYFHNFEGSQPTFFPDGNKIVFSSPRSGRGDIYITDTTSSTLIQLTKNSWYEGEPSISPNGTKIVYVSEKHGPGEIYIMDSDGTNQTQLTDNSKYNYEDSNPVFTKDGEHIIFSRLIRNKYDTIRPGNVVQMMINLDGSGLKELSELQNRLYNSNLYPDGKRLVYQGNNFIIFDENIDSTDRRILARNASSPRLTPDGKKIIFISDRKIKYEYEVYVMSLDNSSTQTNKQLTDLKGYIDNLTISPDGSKLLFLFNDEGGNSMGRGKIYTVNIDGTGFKMIRENY